MKSRHLVDPELISALDMFPVFELNDGTLAELRAAGMPLPFDPDDGVTEEARVIPGPAGAPDLQVLIYRPAGLPANAPALLYIHGGGYVLGSPDRFSAISRAFASNCNCLVLATSYRLAPEARWPAPIDDVHAALCWLHVNSATLGVDADRIAIAGGSAGGGHAASLAIRARDRGGPKILFQSLTYPMLDDRTQRHPFAGEFVWTAKSNAYGWSALLGMPAGSGTVPEEAVPARVRDLSGLPPTYIATAALDIFVEENIEFARRLIAAGVPTELHVAPGAYHGFDSISPSSDVSRRFHAGIHAALSRAFSGARHR